MAKSKTLVASLILVSLFCSVVSAGDWWNNDWKKCRDIDIEPLASHDGVHNYMLTTELTGLSFDNFEEIVIVDAACNNGGTEIPRMIHSNTSTTAKVSFIVNETMSYGIDSVYSVYYDSSTGRGTVLTGYSADETGLDLLMHFEESNGTTASDSSGNEHNFIASDSSIWSNESRFGTGSVFIDSVYRLSRADSFDITTDDSLTIEAWIKSDDFNPLGSLFQYYSTINGGPFYHTSIVSNKSSFDARDVGSNTISGGGLSTGNMTPGVWHHVAFVFNRNDDRGYSYLDGVQFENKSISNIGNITVIPTKVYAIGDNVAAGAKFNGYIDEFVQWGYAKEFGNGPPVVTMGNEEPPKSVSTKLSGEFDYLEEEQIKIKVAVLVKDADGDPVSDAAVNITAYAPNGSVAFSGTNIAENISGTGIYVLESDNIICQSAGPQGCNTANYVKGVYIVHAEANYDGGSVASDMIEFHIDPPGEWTIGVTATDMAVGALLLIGAIGYLTYQRRR